MKNKILELLENSELARNCNSKEFELQYLLTYICETEQERDILRHIMLRKRPSGASLHRIRADIQNTQGLFQPTGEVHKSRGKQEKKVREQYSPINGLISGMKKWFS